MGKLKTSILIFGISLLLTSCYTYTYTVGNGPQTGIKVTQKNHYLVYGLVPVSTSNPTTMAGTSNDYEVTIQHSFIDGLINAITMGIYSTTTTTVTR